MEGKKNSQPTSSFVTGAIALVFLVIGYEAALFVHKAAVLHLAANRDRPDTVYVYDSCHSEQGQGPEQKNLQRSFVASAPQDDKMGDAPRDDRIVRKEYNRSPEVKAVREKASPRRVESFRFNPNTVSLEDLQRLGFSEKQAQAIDNYRQKGGRFRRKADFAKSFVVSDSVYRRLEPYIDIPLLDINKADSLALLSLPGIGPFFAGKVVAYRTQLGGYSTPEQLMEIWHFDEEKYQGLRDLITCSAPEPYPLWTLPEPDLSRHPYISRAEAHGIVLYREHHAPEECTLEGLRQAGILSEEHFVALSRCLLAPAG